MLVSGAFDVDASVGSNFVVADPGATMVFIAASAPKPIGGYILLNMSVMQIFLQKPCFIM